MTKEELFNENIRIAYKIAQKYYHNNYNEKEDIIQVALLGLWKAATTFDQSKGYAFTSYSYRVVQNELNMMYRKLKHSVNTISLETPVADGMTISDIIEDDNIINSVESTVDYIALKEFIDNNMLKFPKKYIDILNMYIDGKTQCQIAKEIGLSQSYISRILIKIKQKIKEFLN